MPPSMWTSQPCDCDNRTMMRMIHLLISNRTEALLNHTPCVNSVVLLRDLRTYYIVVTVSISLAHSHQHHSRVLMFDDVISWIRNAQHERRWQLWKSTVKNFLKQHPDKKLVILEIGAGVNVTFITSCFFLNALFPL